jgi:hypothetical protein
MKIEELKKDKKELIMPKNPVDKESDEEISRKL